jgi:hypothetical protein
LGVAHPFNQQQLHMKMGELDMNLLDQTEFKMVYFPSKMLKILSWRLMRQGLRRPKLCTFLFATRKMLLRPFGGGFERRATPPPVTRIKIQIVIMHDAVECNGLLCRKDKNITSEKTGLSKFL